MSNAADSHNLASMQLVLERSVMRRSLRDYAAAVYPLVTGVPLRLNVATDAIIAALQAVGDGTERRVLLELSPGLGKSTLLTVGESWLLARSASHRHLHACHSADLAHRDSRRVRRVIESAWWQARFAARLRPDEGAVQRWATTAGGEYIATGVGGGVTGHRVHAVFVDDVLNALDAHSKAARDEAWTWLGESASTRVDGDGPILVCGQRLGKDDVAGRLRETGTYTVVTVPAEFDAKRRCVTNIWTDPRTTDGELAAPDVLTASRLTELRAALGSVAFASQYNQDPASDDSSMVPAKWWRFYRSPEGAAGSRRPVGSDESAAVDLPKSFERGIVIAADLSFGSLTGDFAVVQAWGAHGGGRYLLRHWRQRAGFDAQLAAINTFATEFPTAMIVVEKAANGAAVIEQLRKKYPAVLEMKPIGSKAQRLGSVVPQIEGSQCFLPEHAAFTEDVIDEFRAFPGRHDDIVDAAVWALFALTHRRGALENMHGRRAPIAAPIIFEPDGYSGSRVDLGTGLAGCGGPRRVS